MAISDLSGYQTALGQIRDKLGYWDDYANQRSVQRLNTLGDQFSSMFENYVGRAPTQDELNKFYTQSAGNIIGSAPGTQIENDAVNVRNQVGTFIGDTYQKAANEYAQQQLANQQGQANQLADLFRTQGRQAISDTEAGLLDYQQRLFERLRPNLITSLQSQGLLNTGGLNEALAGAQQDLATSAQGALMDARLNNENQANAIAYGGAAAPYLFQQQQITNQPNFLQQAGADALNRAFQTYTQNLNYQQQLGLAAFQNKLQQSSKPSFLSSLGQGFAQNLASAFNPLSAAQIYNQYNQGSYYGVKAALPTGA